MAENILVEISDFNQSRKHLYGGKGYALSNLAHKGFNVPKGVILTTQAFEQYVVFNKRFLKSKQGRNVDHGAILPPQIKLEVVNWLKSNKLNKSRLIIRSSANVEDSKTDSFAGQFKTVINVKGSKEVMKAIIDVYNSVFDERVIEYCMKKRIKFDKIKMAVVVQKLVLGDTAGVMFTRDPLSSSGNTIIESVMGLNEGLVSGRITPSKFVVDSNAGKVLEKHIVDQPIVIAAKKKGIIERKNTKNILSVMNEKKVLQITRQGIKIESIEKIPQDIEWAISKGKIFILQSRPITKMEVASDKNGALSKYDSVAGYPGSNGIVEGKVALVNSPKDNVKDGMVCVFKHTDTLYMKIIEKAKAIVTEEGGVLSHAAIVARELNIPCVVGLGDLSKILRNKDRIRVDGTGGRIYLLDQRSSKATPSGMPFDEADLYCLDRMVPINYKKSRIFYEEFKDRVVYYASAKIGSKKLEAIFPKSKFGDRRLTLGDNIKYLIKDGFESYIQDKETRSLMKRSILEIESFNILRAKRIFKEILRYALSTYAKSKKNSYDSLYLNTLYRLLCYVRIRRAFLLIDTLICEGYGIRILHTKMIPVLKKLGIEFPVFLAKIPEGMKGFYISVLTKKEIKILRDGIKYYKTISRWKQEVYPIYIKHGLQGARFMSKYNAILKKLDRISAKKMTAREWTQVGISVFVTQAK